MSAGSAITSQLLTLSRKNAPIKQATRLNRIIEDICDRLPGNSNVNYKLTMEKNLCPVNCDSKQISQVIQHLISNASQAMPDGGSIDITTENIYHSGNSKLASGDFVFFSIRDYGCGIPAKNIERIFVPYFTTRELSADQGTGLAVVHSIVNKQAD